MGTILAYNDIAFVVAVFVLGFAIGFETAAEFAVRVFGDDKDEKGQNDAS